MLSPGNLSWKPWLGVSKPSAPLLQKKQSEFQQCGVYFSICGTQQLALGIGVYPSRDPWGKEFNKSYQRSRWAKAGKSIASGYVAVLEGIQADQDFVRTLFNPSRNLADFSSSLGICGKKNLLVFSLVWCSLDEIQSPNLVSKASIQSKNVATIAGLFNGYMLRRTLQNTNCYIQTLGGKRNIVKRC